MARVLAQSIAGLLAGQRQAQHKGLGKSKRSANMMCTLRVTGLRMAGFPGFRNVNPLDAVLRPAPDFPFKLSNVISSQRGRASRCVPKAMYERFSEKAIKVIALAQEEARQLGHSFVGTEQILLGLIADGTGIAAKVLKSMGINLEDASVEVEKMIGRGSGSVAIEVPFNAAAKRVLELSVEEARQLGHTYIGSGHLLLGLLREDDGVATRVLENLGADPTNIRTQTIRMVTESVNKMIAALKAKGKSKRVFLM